MAWRIQDWVIRGEIDNRERGVVAGVLWVAGRRDPLCLDLMGNCRRDLAGCLLTFERAAEAPPLMRAPGRAALCPQQGGFAGEMTASRKVRIPSVMGEELHDCIRLGLPIPTQVGNALYLEWFSRENGRVVLESVSFRMHVTESSWNLTEEEERQQLRENARRLREYLRRQTRSGGIV